MFIYDSKLGEYFDNYHWSGNRKLGVLKEEELNKIVLIMQRVSTAYSCGHSEGFTYEEAEFAKLLEQFYSAAFNSGARYAESLQGERIEKAQEKIISILKGL